MALIDVSEYQRQAAQARAAHDAAVASAKVDPYLPTAAAREARIAEARRRYDEAVTVIRANARAELSRAYDKLDARARRAGEDEAAAERKALANVPLGYLELVRSRVAHLSPRELVAALKAARDDTERTLIAGLGAAVVRDRLASAGPDSVGADERHALSDWQSATRAQRSPEMLAVAADLDQLGIARNAIERLDGIAYERELRARYALGDPPAAVPELTQDEASRMVASARAAATR